MLIVMNFTKREQKLLIIASVFFALLVFCVAWFGNKHATVTTLTRENIPHDAVFVDHHHDAKELDESGQPKGEMEHWATPEAMQRGGPIYGIYGYSLVSIEYEVGDSEMGAHAVGKEFPGWNLSSTFLGFKTLVPYDHFHIGIINDDHAEGASTTPHVHEKKYRIHFMLLPHSEELKIGLNCG
jgi:hypothetical protein